MIPTVNPALLSSSLNHVPKSHIYISLKHLQGWRIIHFPGQPVPELDHPSGGGIPPNIESKTDLVQFGVISS